MSGYFYNKYYSEAGCNGTETFIQGYATGMCLPTASGGLVMSCINGTILPFHYVILECPWYLRLALIWLFVPVHVNYLDTGAYITIAEYNTTMCLGSTSGIVYHPMNTCFQIGRTAYGASFSGSCSKSTDGFPTTSKAIIEGYVHNRVETFRNALLLSSWLERIQHYWAVLNTKFAPETLFLQLKLMYRYLCFFSSYAGVANTCNADDTSNRPVTFKAFLEKTCSPVATTTLRNQYTCGDKCELPISMILL